MTILSNQKLLLTFIVICFLSVALGVSADLFEKIWVLP